MIVKCHSSDCAHWDPFGGSFEGEGGCTLDIISISNDESSANFYAICEDYEERRPSEDDE